MKLGPALKLRSILAKKLGGPCPCVACVAQAQQMLALQTGGAAATGATAGAGAGTESATNSCSIKSEIFNGGSNGSSSGSSSNQGSDVAAPPAAAASSPSSNMLLPVLPCSGLQDAS
ncbi:GM11193 [Drosophila sechellia]|uniref:GM11193 n=2 Tax=Drosophila sechellia TaxID=7238 RepID=B4HWZ9_DROSE|nr:GM11193 [Drosophila sechellia]